jgi:hypothetical protein
LCGDKEVQIQLSKDTSLEKNEEGSLLEQTKDAHQIKSSILPANLQNI